MLAAANALNTGRKKNDKNDYTSVLDKNGKILTEAEFLKKYENKLVKPNAADYTGRLYHVDHTTGKYVVADDPDKYKDLYKKLKDLVVDKYNSQPGTRDLSSIITGSSKSMGPKGGGIQPVVMQFNFDVQKPSDDLVTLATVLGTVRKSSNSFIRIGAPGSEIPKENDEKAQLLLDELTSNMTTAYGKADADRPVGSVTFSPIVGGTDKYHYYNIKLDAQYLKKLIGTKENPGILYGKDEQISSLKTKGVSIYIPANEDVSLIGQRSVKGASEYEAIMNLSPDGKYMYKRPDGSYFEMYKTSGGGIIITGKYKGYDQTTGKVIEIPYNPNREIANIGNVPLDDYMDANVFPKFDQLLEYNNSISQNPSPNTKLIKDPSLIK